MANQRLPLFGAGLQGKSAVITSQHRINLYADVQAVEDRTKIAFYGTAGLVLAAIVRTGIIRGWVAYGAYLYVVAGTTLLRYDSSFVAGPALGTLLTTTGRVSMAAAGDYVGVVDGTAGYTYKLSTGAFAQILDGDFPNTSNWIAWQGGYWIFDDGDNWFVSDLDNPTSHDATKAASAESIPDSIVRIHADDTVMLFGPHNVEFWANSGGLDFPYSRIGQGSALPVGLRAPESLAVYRDGIAFLGEEKSGGIKLYTFSPGSGLSAISSAEWESIVAGYAAADIDAATGLAYSYGGHVFYQINFPRVSWLYDGLLLSELRCSPAHQLITGNSRHLADRAVVFAGQTYVASYAEGKIYRIVPEVYTDDGEIVRREITSRHVFSDQPVPVLDLWAEVEAGVGLTGESAPYLELTVSRDGGRTFGSHQLASVGALGEYQTRVRFGAQGADYVKTFRLAYAQPTKFVLTGEGYIDGA